jgi:DNA-binding HxlR family transcriptional regulator
MSGDNMAVNSRNQRQKPADKPMKPLPGVLTRDSSKSKDHLLHERSRLAIISALAANDALSFNDLKAALQISDGNLSVHARKLEDAGYLSCSKGYEGRVPRTEYRVTAVGREALLSYVNHMEALIRAVRKI